MREDVHARSIKFPRVEATGFHPLWKGDIFPFDRFTGYMKSNQNQFGRVLQFAFALTCYKLIKTRHRRSTKKLPMLSVEPLPPANCLLKLNILQSRIPGPRNSTCSLKFIRLVILNVQSFQLVTAQPPTAMPTLILWWLLLWDNYRATWKTQITRFKSWNRLRFQAQIDVFSL